MSQPHVPPPAAPAAPAGVAYAQPASDALGPALVDALFAQSPLSVALYDLAGQVAAANPAYERFFGIRLADVPPDYSLFTDPQLAAGGLVAEIRRAYAGDAVVLPPARYDAARATAGVGRAVWTQGHCFPVRDAGGRVAYVAVVHTDVTAWAEAEAALARQSALTRLVADNATSALFMMDRDGHPTYMNAAAAATTGYTLDEIRWMPLHYAVHHRRPDGSPYPMAECPIDRALPENFDVRAHRDVFLRKDGSFFPVVCAASPILEGGVPVGTVVEVRDVTAEQEAERVLQQLNAELAARNAELQEQGLELELANQQLQDQAAELEATAEALQATTEDLIEAAAAREAALAELAEGEARLSGIIGSAMDAIVATDEERRIVLFNAAAERLFGATAADVVGQSLDRFVPERHRAAHGGHMRAFGETGVTARSMHRAPGPLPALRADGREFPVEAAISQAVVGGRRLFTVVLRDVTERVAAEEERERLLSAEHAARTAAELARARAEEANAVKAQFLATMSHELRTPLNAIAGHVQLLELGLHGPVTDAQRESLGRVERAQRHLLGLINDVLNYARLESGRVEYDVRPVAVADVVADVAPMIEPQLRAKGLAFDVRLLDAAGRPPALVWADREKLAQVLLNLLSNAIKFTEPGGRVSVELDEAADGVDVAGLAYLRVSDTGRGIPPDKLEAVFEPFVQVGKGYAGEAPGTGLGLAISRDLARGMGGDLTAESTPGEGSTFTLVLPRAAGV